MKLGNANTRLWLRVKDQASNLLATASLLKQSEGQMDNLVKTPSCEYSFLPTPKPGASWLKKFPSYFVHARSHPHHRRGCGRGASHSIVGFNFKNWDLYASNSGTVIFFSMHNPLICNAHHNSRITDISSFSQTPNYYTLSLANSPKSRGCNARALS